MISELKNWSQLRGHGECMEENRKQQGSVLRECGQWKKEAKEAYQVSGMVVIR